MEASVPRPELVKLDELNFAVYNPRVMDDDEMRKLKASLSKHGMVTSLVVQKKADDGTPHVLIGGHQRVRAMRELATDAGEPVPQELYAVVLDVSDAEAKMLNVGLNRISGQFDEFKLGELFASIAPSLGPGDADSFGFSDEEVAALISEVALPEDLADQMKDEMEGETITTPPAEPAVSTLTVPFPTRDDRDVAARKLAALAKELELTHGAALLEALEESLMERRDG